MAENTTNQIEGTVSAVVFRNEENGYVILRLQTQGDEVTVVGCVPNAAPGEFLSVRGLWTRHPRFGEQFKAEQVERRMPRGVKETFHYLASGAVKGIGESTARRIVEEFGEDSLTVLEESPETLTQIKGITLKRALAMQKAFQEKMGLRVLMEFLTAHGFSARLGAELYHRWGAPALNMIKSNPYLLVDEEWGVDFAAADALGEALGFGADDPLRLACALTFELSHNQNNGHVFLPREKLVRAASQLSAASEAQLEECLNDLLDRSEVMQEEIAGETAVYPADLWQAERKVAGRLLQMRDDPPAPPRELKRLLRRVQQRQKITYAPAQLEAIELAAVSRVMLLTGGPGTGKTTTMRGVLALFDELGLDTELAAPTGRAAQRLGATCGAEAATVHRLLEAGIDIRTGRLAFHKNGADPLRADAVIVDEASMVDLPLMASLIDALHPNCRLILVGDPDQLPSVGPGCVFADLIRSGEIPTARLTEIFRQAAESAIVRSAHQVNGGQMPDLRAGGDFFFLRRDDPVDAAQTVVDLCRRRLPERMGIPADQIQVLSPTRRQGAGTAALNRLLQQALNPPAEEKGERAMGEYVFRLGDRVMQVRNNYDVLWRSPDGGQSGMGVFNGDVGRIVSVSPRGEVIAVDFDGRIAEYTPDMLPELEPAYAVTVHKAQGSEYRAVIFLAVETVPQLMTRDILYTAVTRARSLLIIVGDERVVERMVAGDRKKRRYCGLRARLKQGADG